MKMHILFLWAIWFWKSYHMISKTTESVDGSYRNTCREGVHELNNIFTGNANCPDMFLIQLAKEDQSWRWRIREAGMKGARNKWIGQKSEEFRPIFTGQGLSPDAPFVKGRKARGVWAYSSDNSINSGSSRGSGFVMTNILLHALHLNFPVFTFTLVSSTQYLFPHSSQQISMTSLPPDSTYPVCHWHSHTESRALYRSYVN